MTFIVKPLVTEKMTKLTDKSSVAKTYKVKGQERTKKAETKYGFIVLPEANKHVPITLCLCPGVTGLNLRTAIFYFRYCCKNRFHRPP